MKQDSLAIDEQEVTISLPRPLVAEMRRVVEEGLAFSQGQLVREAIAMYLRAHHQPMDDETIFVTLSNAMKNDVFLREEREIIEDFAYTDAETAKWLDEDS